MPWARAGSTARRATSRSVRPSRDIPVSAWMSAARAAPCSRQKRAHASISARLLSTGTRRWSAKTWPAAPANPLSTWTAASGSRFLSAIPSPVWATKKVEHPAAARAGATRSMPRP